MKESVYILFLYSSSVSIDYRQFLTYQSCFTRQITATKYKQVLFNQVTPN